MIHHKDWDINEAITGRFHTHPVTGKKSPIIGATLQNGLNDIEPDGSFVPCDMGLDAVVDGVTTHRVKRGRYGELRFADTGSANKHLCKIKYKDGKGLSFKYLGGDSGLPDVANGKPSFVADNGVTIEHTPTYKGVRIELVINDPLTAPLEYSFSMKTYGQSYTFIEQDGGIVARGEDLMPISIHAPYAVDANGDEGPVTMVLTEAVGGLQTFKKVVDETWFRQAVAPVRIDPSVTIDSSTGTLEDTLFSSFATNRNFNFGQSANIGLHSFDPTNEADTWAKVGLGLYSGVTVTVTVAEWIFDIYQTPGPLTIDGYECLKPVTTEGTKSGSNASPGEPTWNSYSSPNLWATLGGRGSGTDRTVSPDYSKFASGVDSNFRFTVSNVLAQYWVDNPSLNYGELFDQTDAPTGTLGISWRASTATTGNRFAFYMEYTSAAAAGRRRRILLGAN